MLVKNLDLHTSYVISKYSSFVQTAYDHVFPFLFHIISLSHNSMTSSVPSSSFCRTHPVQILFTCLLSFTLHKCPHQFSCVPFICPRIDFIPNSSQQLLIFSSYAEGRIVILWASKLLIE